LELLADFVADVDTNLQYHSPDVEMKRLTVSAGPNRYGKRAISKDEFSMGKPNSAKYGKLIVFVNRKDWWHVPPVDPDA
jgi:hypothetical protein